MKAGAIVGFNEKYIYIYMKTKLVARICPFLLRTIQ
jgi:hypothetical protein